MSVTPPSKPFLVAGRAGKPNTNTNATHEIPQSLGVPNIIHPPKISPQVSPLSPQSSPLSYKTMITSIKHVSISPHPCKAQDTNTVVVQNVDQKIVSKAITPLKLRIYELMFPKVKNDNKNDYIQFRPVETDTQSYSIIMEAYMGEQIYASITTATFSCEAIASFFLPQQYPIHEVLINECKLVALHLCYPQPIKKQTDTDKNQNDFKDSRLDVDPERILQMISFVRHVFVSWSPYFAKHMSTISFGPSFNYKHFVDQCKKLIACDIVMLRPSWDFVKEFSKFHPIADFVLPPTPFQLDSIEDD